MFFPAFLPWPPADLHSYNSYKKPLSPHLSQWLCFPDKTLTDRAKNYTDEHGDTLHRIQDTGALLVGGCVGAGQH